MFVVGAGLGGGGGYWAGLGASPVVAAVEDEELRELRRLARAPIEELISRRLVFLRLLGTDYRGDEVLWHGFERLCDAVEADSGFPDRHITARLLAQQIELADPHFEARFRHRVKSLRAIR